MAWITVTEADVLTVLSGPELTGYRNAAKAVGQADPVTPTIEQVVKLARGYVGACKANTLGAGVTIPEKLLQPTLDIIAVRIPRRVGKDPKDSRQDAHDKAVKLLEQVARCEFDIEEPATATAETSSNPTPSIATRGDRKYTRDNQDGI